MKETISPVRNWMYSGFGALGSFVQNWAICDYLIDLAKHNLKKKKENYIGKNAERYKLSIFLIVQ